MPTDLQALPQPIQALIGHLGSDDGRWPLSCEEPIAKALNTWAALRESEKEAIKAMAGWTDAARSYRVDPLPERIADAWAAYLWGEDARILAADPQDQARLDDLLGLDNNGAGGILLASELERAAGISVSEGEVWSRIYVDEAVAPRPLLEWHSRRHVIPLWVGPRLAAVALRTDLPVRDEDKTANVRYRHFELHADGYVVNALYQGEAAKLGTRVDLDQYPLTADLQEVWETGIPGMLMQRIPNRLRGNVKLGVSDYAGIFDFLLDLNEAATIGSSNMRLTARKRAVISASAAASASRRPTDELLEAEDSALGTGAPRARFDPAEEIFVEDPLDAEMGGSSASPFRVIEYGFDAENLIAWKRSLVDDALSRIGLTGQYVGAGDQSGVGYAISGTALRLRLIPTDKAGRAKARYWDDGAPRIMGNMARLDNAPNGFNRGWLKAEQPTVTRRPGLPVDELEEAQKHATLVTAGVESVRNAVAELHPDWDDERIDAEVAAIRDDKRAMTPGGIGSVLGA